MEKIDVINNMNTVGKMIADETEKENPNGSLITKLLFEHYLRGLYLQNFPM